METKINKITTNIFVKVVYTLRKSERLKDLLSNACRTEEKVLHLMEKDYAGNSD